MEQYLLFSVKKEGLRRSNAAIISIPLRPAPHASEGGKFGKILSESRLTSCKNGERIVQCPVIECVLKQEIRYKIFPTNDLVLFLYSKLLSCYISLFCKKSNLFLFIEDFIPVITPSSRIYLKSCIWHQVLAFALTRVHEDHLCFCYAAKFPRKQGCPWWPWVWLACFAVGFTVKSMIRWLLLPHRNTRRLFAWPQGRGVLTFWIVMAHGKIIPADLTSTSFWKAL